MYTIVDYNSQKSKIQLEKRKRLVQPRQAQDELAKWRFSARQPVWLMLFRIGRGS